MPVTCHTGGLEMHPLFLTIGNIQSDIRMQAMSHAWHCIAFIPSPEFKVNCAFKSLLSAHVFHWLLDDVSANLKAAALDGCDLTDPSGYQCNCYTPLVSYIADLPEQQLVSGVSRNASPVMLTEIAQFGDSTPAAPRTHEHTLRLILDLCNAVDAWDLAAFQKAAKALKLLGVHLPFWQDWMFSNPSLFLTSKILHTLHKFFFNHILAWCKEVAGSHTLDVQFSHLHPHISFHHFSSGVSQPLKMTGHDHRDIERTIAPILDGAGKVTDDFILAIRAMVEFIYHAQNSVHTNSSIAVMEKALSRFHEKKQSIITLGGRKNHFKIPKLKLMQSFTQQTKANSALIQYMADVTEQLLITHCKTTFQRTSRQTSTYVDQVVDILNREETMRLFDLYIVLHRAEHTAMETVVQAESEEVTTLDPTLEFIQRVAPEMESTFHGPCPFRNHFQNPKSLLSMDGEVALHTTICPDHKTLTVASMQATYNLPDLPALINRYIIEALQDHSRLDWTHAVTTSAWNKFRVQLHSSFHSRFVEKSQVVQACPPLGEYPLGRCDAVLLHSQDHYGMIYCFPHSPADYFLSCRSSPSSVHADRPWIT